MRRRAFMPRTAISGLVCTTFLVLLVFPAVPQEPAGKGADTESGQQTFNNACRTCHTTKEGDNRLGPNLHNIIGRKAGSLQNYGYSSAMKGADFVLLDKPGCPRTSSRRSRTLASCARRCLLVRCRMTLRGIARPGSRRHKDAAKCWDHEQAADRRQQHAANNHAGQRLLHLRADAGGNSGR